MKIRITTEREFSATDLPAYVRALHRVGIRLNIGVLIKTGKWVDCQGDAGEIVETVYQIIREEKA